MVSEVRGDEPVQSYWVAGVLDPVHISHLHRDGEFFYNPDCIEARDEGNIAAPVRYKCFGASEVTGVGDFPCLEVNALVLHEGPLAWEIQLNGGIHSEYGQGSMFSACQEGGIRLAGAGFNSFFQAFSLVLRSFPPHGLNLSRLTRDAGTRHGSFLSRMFWESVEQSYSYLGSCR